MDPETEASGGAVAGELTPFLQDHFASLPQQAAAARFGMWIFLATEVLLFAGLIVCYIAYRSLYWETFALASHHLDRTLGTVETVVLITSSLFAVLALHFVRVGHRNNTIIYLALTMAMGAAFLVLHGLEYAHEFREGIMPGSHYHYAEMPVQGAIMFFTIYFMLTGLHSLHVIAGVGVLGWILIKVLKRQAGPAYDVPVEIATLYWHLVDVIWIFLYPMLYLAA